jgi:hypothetical protein
VLRFGQHQLIGFCVLKHYLSIDGSSQERRADRTSLRNRAFLFTLGAKECATPKEYPAALSVSEELVGANGFFIDAGVNQ